MGLGVCLSDACCVMVQFSLEDIAFELSCVQLHMFIVALELKYPTGKWFVVDRLGIVGNDVFYYTRPLKCPSSTSCLPRVSSCFLPLSLHFDLELARYSQAESSSALAHSPIAAIPSVCSWSCLPTVWGSSLSEGKHGRGSDPLSMCFTPPLR